MGQLKADAEQFMAWRAKGAKRIKPRFPRPYGWSIAERAVIFDVPAHTLQQQFAHFVSPGSQRVDVREPE